MTAAVITDTGARGRLSELVLAIVVMADLVLLVLFSVSMQAARVALNPDVRLSVGRRGGAHGVGGRRRAGLRRAGGRAVRALPALRRARGAAGAPGRVRAPEPDGFDPAVRAAAGGHGRRSRDREPVGGPGRRAAGRRAPGRAAGAGGVLRGRGRVAAPRCHHVNRAGRVPAGARAASGRSGSAWRPACERRASIRSRPGTRGRAWCRRRASRWDSPPWRPTSSAAGPRRCSCCWWAPSRSTSWWGPWCFDGASRRPASWIRPRRGRCSWPRTASPISTCGRRTAAWRCSPPPAAWPWRWTR